jgi:hypothetical protein
MAASLNGVCLTSKNGDTHEIPSVTEVQAGLNKRQKVLTAGTGISIVPSGSTDTISSTVDPYNDTELRDMITALQDAIIYIDIIDSPHTFN